MGLFGMGKKNPEAEGDRWYEKSLRGGDRKLEYLRKSASLGSKKGMMGLARYYWEFYADDTATIRQAAALAEKAEAAGAAPDDALLGRIYDHLGRKEEAAERCRRGAEQGDGWCQFKTGQNYDAGGLFEGDADKARVWYEKAAQQNEAGAFGGLGVLYREGRGVEKDEKRSHSLLSAGAQLGDLTACGYLAWDYLRGEHGCPIDYEKAAAYAQKGIWKWGGETRCRYVMAILRCEGWGGVQENYDEGWLTLRELGRAGFKPAEAAREECYRRRLTREDKHYRKAKAAGTREAMEQAAAAGSLMANLYFLRESADRLAAGETLTDEELLGYLKNFTRCYHGLFAAPPREILYPLLDAVTDRGLEYLDSKSYRSALDLVHDACLSKHPGCQYVRITAFCCLKAEFTAWESTFDEGIRYCREFLDNPEASQDEKYARMYKHVEKHLESLQFLKSLRGELVHKSSEQWRQRLEEEHQRSLEILGE